MEELVRVGGSCPGCRGAEAHALPASFQLGVLSGSLEESWPLRREPGGSFSLSGKPAPGTAGILPFVHSALPYLLSPEFALLTSAW